MANLSDFNTAARMREVVGAIIRDIIAQERPAVRFAQVTAVSPLLRVAAVQRPGESIPFPVPYGAVRPRVGSVVRLAGKTGAAYIEDAVSHPFGDIPLGVAVPYFGPVAPDGYAFPVGQTYARADYPELAKEIAPDSSSPFWVDADNFKMPDLRDTFLAGRGSASWADTVGKTGGSKDAIVVSHTHQMPQHQHTMAHTHQIDPPNTTTNQSDIVRATGGGNAQLVAGTGAYGPYNTSTASVNIAAFTSGGSSAANTGNATSTPNVQTVGDPATDANLPPYVVCNFIMRLA